MHLESLQNIHQWNLCGELKIVGMLMSCKEGPQITVDCSGYGSVGLLQIITLNVIGNKEPHTSQNRQRSLFI